MTSQEPIDEEIEKRLRAIYTGLYPYLDSEKLKLAIQLWQRDFTEKPSFALSGFLSSVCDTPELRAQRTTILTAILRAMEGLDSDLLQLPNEKSSAISPIPTQELQSHHDSQSKVFCDLVINMLAKLDGHEESVLSYALSMLSETLVSAEHRVAMRNWLIRRDTRGIDSLGTSELRKMINLIYVAICEWEGAVRADQILAQSKKETEQLAKELEFKLETLL